MKVKLSIATASLLVSMSALAQTYDLKSGWNLVGSYENGVSASVFSDANSIWKYGENGWSAASPNGTLTTALNDANLLNSSLTLNAGEGFWINSKDGNGTITSGTLESNTTLSLGDGWQLLSLKNQTPISASTVFNQDKVSTVWKYTDTGWAAYSPNATLAQTIKDAGIAELTSINPGEGFWVNASGDQDVLSTPPSISAAYALVEKNNAIPMSEATVWKCNSNGTQTKVGMTNAAGVFDLGTLVNGDKVVVTKSGFAPAFGIVSNGQLQLMSQPMSQMDIPLTAAESTSEKPASKVLNSGDGTVQIIINTMTLNEDVTVAVSSFVSPSAAPALNTITGKDASNNDISVSPEEMLIIGGAHITVEDSNGETKFSVDGTFDAKVKQSSILSDLDLILNGQNEVPSEDFVKLAEDTKTQLDQAISDDIISLYTLVFKDGVWEYAGKAKIAEYTKVYKEKTYKKYRLETGDDVSLTSLDTFAFVMKMNSLKGDLTINVKEGGYKMFDGEIVTKSQSDTSDFDWIATDISSATVFGDEAITSPVSATNTDGNVTMNYKVPFVNPTATLSIKKEGYYDGAVTCTMSPNGAECPTVTLYKIPDTSSVEGYVYDNVTKDGIDDALVTLVNPEVLSADNIVSSVDLNGTASIEVGYLANITYTWTAKKDDANITLKTGKADKSYAMLSEDEIYTTIVDEYNDGTPPSTYPANPAGTWTLTVKAEHEFTGGKTLVEQAVGSFNLDLDTEKLASKLSGALNEGSISYKDGLGYTANLPALYNTSVYGGIQTGFLYAIGGKDDWNAWETHIVGYGGNDANEDLVSDDINVPGTSTKITCIDDPDATSVGLCNYDIAEESLVYDNSIFPAGYMIGHVANNFDKLLQEDPADVGKNFLASGFTISTRYKGIVIAPDSLINPDSELKGTDTEHNVTVRVASNIDLSNGVGAVKEMLDVPSIGLVGESATAYLRQVITDTDGSYQINMIPTELSGSLKIFGKAEGYKFESDASLDVKLVDDLETGVISQYDLYLNPITTETNTSEPAPVSTDFTSWTIATCGTNGDTVKWNNLTDINSVDVTGYITTVYGETSLDLLPDLDTGGYLWFGNTANGTFSNITSNYSSSKTCGSITSPEISLADYAFPTLDFKTWFEVESADIAKGMYDQMEIGFIPKENATLYAINGSTVDVTAGQYYKLDLLNPDYEPAVQSSSVPYTSAGVDAEPKWLEVTLPVEQLAGQTVQFVFTFDSKDSLYNGYRGWGVDAVNVKESMDDNLENPPTIPNIDDDTVFTTAKVLTKTLR